MGIADGQFDGTSVYGQPGNYSDNGGAFTANLTVADRCAAQVSICVSQVDVCWIGCSNRLYQVQYRSALTTNNWVNLTSPILSKDGTNVISDAIAVGEPRRFYRVLTLP